MEHEQQKTAVLIEVPVSEPHGYSTTLHSQKEKAPGKTSSRGLRIHGESWPSSRYDRVPTGTMIAPTDADVTFLGKISGHWPEKAW